LALAIQGDIQKIVFHFLATAPNRFLVEAGDERELGIAGTIGFLRKHSDVPASLGFSEPAEEEIDLAVIPHHLFISLLLADWTFTLVE
jgi:hypothetical protein